MRNEALLRRRFAGVLARVERLTLVHRMRDHQQRIAELEAQVSTGAFDDVFDRLTTEYALGFKTMGARLV